MSERAIKFECNNTDVVGIVHVPHNAKKRAVLIVVGGPQYRVGSHRQFLLLARYLSAQGFPVLRYDYRGMGDSGGEIRTFESIGSDIRSAVDVLCQEVPGVEEVVIWGLCDAASAALFYAHQDSRIVGLVLLNPWVRTEAGLAKAYLKHYYLSRLIDPQLWLKIVRGNFNLKESLLSFFTQAKKVLSTQEKPGKISAVTELPLPQRMLDGYQKFTGHSLVILSGDDITADEFRDVVKSSRQWRRMLKSKRVATQELKGANHTFAQRVWRDQVARWTDEWLRSF